MEGNYEGGCWLLINYYGNDSRAYFAFQAEKYQLLMRFVGRGVRDIASNMKLEDRTKPGMKK